MSVIIQSDILNSRITIIKFTNKEPYIVDFDEIMFLPCLCNLFVVFFYALKNCQKNRKITYYRTNYVDIISQKKIRKYVMFGVLLLILSFLCFDIKNTKPGMYYGVLTRVKRNQIFDDKLKYLLDRIKHLTYINNSIRIYLVQQFSL